jgi:arabinose-5-phosphate isomerase
MHSGDDLPAIAPGTSVMDAIMDISSKRLGITVILDNNKKVLGIITDGDVRRGMQKWGKDFLDMKADQVMTKGPKTLNAEELAAKALSIMESFSITSLVVTDDKDRAAGIIHLHDILKKGIV